MPGGPSEPADPWFGHALVARLWLGLLVGSSGHGSGSGFSTLDYLRRIAVENDKVDVAHPRNVVRHLAKSQKVDYVTSYRNGDNETGFFCKVSVGDTVIAAVGGCATKDEAIVTAAEKAVDLLKM